jgi:Na+/H+ antiporter NhaD/arsenite permease-like protein
LRVIWKHVPDKLAANGSQEPAWGIEIAVPLLLPPLVGAVQPALDLPVWSVTPFVLLLAAIAFLPLVAGQWWHRNRNKGMVVAILAAPAVVYLGLVQVRAGQPTLVALGDELVKYVFFILLLGSLYVISGGIVFAGHVEGTPLTNTAVLAFGAILANLIGTTGSSVLLIRPILRINQFRKNIGHLPIFFIFTVSNLGGLLTPLGDPPLFLGFLNGVPFFWTLRLWRPWLFVNGTVLLIFWCWDTLSHRREARAGQGLSAPGGSPLAAAAQDPPIAMHHSPIRLKGLVNLIFLGGVIGGILLQRVLPGLWGEAVGALVMASMAVLSLIFTPLPLRHANGFTWEPILEVAILFAGIFVTMVPALIILAANRAVFGITEPWQYLWLTGSMSAFLDNAPTYLTFATMAAGSDDFHLLVSDQVPGIDGPLVLKAISCGAVFMGAMTYIGNGPNFMVKAIADGAGYRTPSFLGFLGYSGTVLLPVLAVMTAVFFAQ